jgi:hypothetical protein
VGPRKFWERDTACYLHTRAAGGLDHSNVLPCLMPHFRLGLVQDRVWLFGRSYLVVPAKSESHTLSLGDSRLFSSASCASSAKKTSILPLKGQGHGKTYLSGCCELTQYHAMYCVRMCRRWWSRSECRSLKVKLERIGQNKQHHITVRPMREWHSGVLLVRWNRSLLCAGKVNCLLVPKKSMQATGCTTRIWRRRDSPLTSSTG